MKTDSDTLARLHCAILLGTSMNSEIRLPALFVSDLLFEIEHARKVAKGVTE